MIGDLNMVGLMMVVYVQDIGVLAMITHCVHFIKRISVIIGMLVLNSMSGCSYLGNIGVRNSA
jgi:hypothetical protein